MRLKRLRKLLRTVMRSPTEAGERTGAPVPRRISVLRDFMASHRIETVIDVGANGGQFACLLRERIAYQGRIISVEPLPDAFASLQAKAASDDKWSVLNMALGDADTALSLNIAGSSGFSSILPMLDRCVQSAPRSAYVGRVEVPIRRLDSLLELRAAAAERCLLKMDAQGYEHRILQGAASVIDGLSLIYLESSLVPLYDGELLIEEMIAYLRQRRFVPVDISRGYSDRVSGQQLQADILFARV
jgi:FkbM family methyltransferase